MKHARDGPAGVLLAASVVSAQDSVTLFVISESTDTVNVYRGRVPDLALVSAIKVGREPQPGRLAGRPLGRHERSPLGQGVSDRHPSDQ